MQDQASAASLGVTAEEQGHDYSPLPVEKEDVAETEIHHGSVSYAIESCARRCIPFPSQPNDKSNQVVPLTVTSLSPRQSIRLDFARSVLSSLLAAAEEDDNDDE